MLKRPAPRKQPAIKDKLTQEKIDETIAEIRRNGASEDIIESVKGALAKYVISTEDEAAIKDALQQNPYYDDMGDSDGTEDYDGSTGEPRMKRKRVAGEDDGVGPSGTATSTTKRVKGEPKRKRETPKKKHGRDEPHARIISPPIGNIGPNRKTYFRIMEETVKDNDKIKEMWKKFGPLINKAAVVIAKERFKSKNNCSM